MKAGGSGPPDEEATRLLSLAADQIALGLRRDRLRQDATTAEVARRSDALKSALLDSVSHDLRTPLASIRATAGNLADPAVDWSPDGVRARRRHDRSGGPAPRPAGRLGPRPEPDRVRGAPARSRGPRCGRAHRAAPWRVCVTTSADGPSRSTWRRISRSILVDAVLFDAIVSNILNNVVTTRRGHEGGHLCATIRRRGPSSSRSRTAARAWRTPTWPGSSTSSSERGRRARAPGAAWASGSRSCAGWPTRSAGPPRPIARELGGLAISLELPAAPAPPDDDVDR